MEEQEDQGQDVLFQINFTPFIDNQGAPYFVCQVDEDIIGEYEYPGQAISDILGYFGIEALVSLNNVDATIH